MDRYVVGTFKGDDAVIDMDGTIRRVIARCGVRANAEKIADALNMAASLEASAADTLATVQGRPMGYTVP